jgi:hypothetical protein
MTAREDIHCLWKNRSGKNKKPLINTDERKRIIGGHPWSYFFLITINSQIPSDGIPDTVLLSFGGNQLFF